MIRQGEAVTALTPALPASPLALPEYRLYWIARFLATFASTAMVVVIGWQVYDTARGEYGMSIAQAALQLGLVGLAQFLPLLLLTPFALDAVLYEVVSAFATVGLSTGITAQVGVPGQLLLVVLMFLGRLGPITLASALALRSRPKLYEVPYERPLIG